MSNHRQQSVTEREREQRKHREHMQAAMASTLILRPLVSTWLTRLPVTISSEPTMAKFAHDLLHDFLDQAPRVLQIRQAAQEKTTAENQKV